MLNGFKTFRFPGVMLVLLCLSGTVPGFTGGGPHDPWTGAWLKGDWVQVSRERNGKKLAVKKIVMSFKDDTYRALEEGKLVEQGIVVLDPGKQPKTYRATMTGDFPNQGKGYNGIYKLEGDVFTTCVNLVPGMPSPSEFASKPGTNYQLIVWKRAAQPSTLVEDRDWLVYKGKEKAHAGGKWVQARAKDSPFQAVLRFTGPNIGTNKYFVVSVQAEHPDFNTPKKPFPGFAMFQFELKERDGKRFLVPTKEFTALAKKRGITEIPYRLEQGRLIIEGGALIVRHGAGSDTVDLKGEYLPVEK